MACLLLAGSVKHFSVLSSDNTFRLYCLDDLTIAEQTFNLQLRRSRSAHAYAPNAMDWETQTDAAVGIPAYLSHPSSF